MQEVLLQLSIICYNCQNEHEEIRECHFLHNRGCVSFVLMGHLSNKNISFRTWAENYHSDICARYALYEGRLLLIYLSKYLAFVFNRLLRRRGREGSTRDWRALRSAVSTGDQCSDAGGVSGNTRLALRLGTDGQSSAVRLAAAVCRAIA